MISKKEFNNFTTYGTISVASDGTTSTCSTNNYLSSVVVPSWASGYVFQIHLKWGSTTGGSYYSIHYPSGQTGPFYMNSNGMTILDTTGTSIGSMSGLGLTANEEAWVRLSWNGSTYTLSKSSDGVTFTTASTLSSNKALRSGQVSWLGRGQTYSFAGVIYLKDCWVKNSAGQYVWTPWSVFDASGAVSVTEGYYNSGTYELTPPFTKTSFRDLIDNQSIACKNNLDLLDLGSSQYAYVLDETGAPVGSYDHYVKVSEVYVSPGKDYLLGKTPGSLAFELDTGYVKNSNTGWTYDADTASTYHLYSTVSKDITDLFADQQKSTTNTLYLVNEVKSSLEDSDFTPGIVSGSFSSAMEGSPIISSHCATTTDFAFFKDTSSSPYKLMKTHDGIHFEEVPTTFTNLFVSTNGSDKVFVYTSSSGKYYYSINGGNSFMSATNESWAGVAEAVVVGNYCIVYDGLHLYASSNFDDWTQLPYSISQVSSIAYANSHYLIACEGSSAAYLTDDFSNFTMVTLSGHLQYPLVVFDDTFYAPLDNVQFASSTDGISWSAALGSALDTGMTVCGDFIFKKLSGVVYRSTDGVTWDSCSGTTTMPRVALGASYQVCATKNRLVAYGKNSTTTFTDISWAQYFSTSDYPYAIPTGFVVVGPSGLYVVNSTVKRSTITASSDPTDLSENYVDYADSGYTVTLNAALDTIESVQEAS